MLQWILFVAEVSAQAVKLTFFLSRLAAYVCLLCPAFLGMFSYILFKRNTVSVPYKSRAEGGGCRHTCDVYLPAATVEAQAQGRRPSPTAPVIVCIAGGAWAIGHKCYVCLLCRVLRAAGFVCIAVDYRYWPQVGVDGMAEDLDLAMAWTLQHVAEFGGDPKRVTLLSLSSGAHIAALLLARRARSAASGTRGGESWTSADLLGFVGLAGVYDLSSDFVGSLFSKGFFQPVLDAVFGATEAVRAERSPTVLLQRHPELVQHWPATLLVHCIGDKISPLYQSEAFSDTLRAAGGNVRLVIRPGGGHNDPVIHNPLMSDHSIVRDILLAVQRWEAEAAEATAEGEGRSQEKQPAAAMQRAGQEQVPTLPTWPRFPAAWVQASRQVTPF